MPADYDLLRSLLDAVRDTARMVDADPDGPRAAERLANARSLYARARVATKRHDPALDELRSRMQISFAGDVDRRWADAFEEAGSVTGAGRSEIARAIARDAQGCRDAVP